MTDCHKHFNSKRARKSEDEGHEGEGGGHGEKIVLTSCVASMPFMFALLLK